jgi:hypothetical protein
MVPASHSSPMLILFIPTLYTKAVPSKTPKTNWNPSGAFQTGKATHYGPFPDFPAWSEPGYYPNDVGVGCSTGVPGGDPNWNSILSKGVQRNPLSEMTVWPITPTVAVSEAAWNKKDVCWKTLKIRNKNNPSLQVEAVIVDFCPRNGCLWNRTERSFNVDIYGQETWKKLGGGVLDGKMQIEVAWPAGLIPNSATAVTITFLALLPFLI